jgi:hypothetical protein
VISNLFDLAVVAFALVASGNAATIDVGSRLEPLVDDYLIDSLKGATLTLHAPVMREVAVVHDRPWEGNVCAYHTVFRDGDLCRMYYRGQHYDTKTGKLSPEVTCYAESKDGVHWTKPDLGLVEFAGSRHNNIILANMPATHNFAPFLDTNPACKPEQRYKALGCGGGGLMAFKSNDAIHWTPLQEKPVITKGLFDSQNLAFWDCTRQRYVGFHRDMRDNVRDILTSNSTDFMHWTEPVWLEYPGAAKEHLYTNQIVPYFRAPHIFFGFPKRFVPGRKAVDMSPNNDGVSDGLFMTSRDGLNFHRWSEALIRPGLQKERWINRNNMTAEGILVTGADTPGMPDELSIYSTENYYRGESCRLRRFTVRIDGFVSIRAGSKSGKMLTHPLTFQGKTLTINGSTSGAGSIRVELQDESGKPIPGYTLDDSTEFYGDEISHTMAWKQGTDLGKLVGRPVRLRFVLKDADLYAIQFRDKPADGIR